MEWSGKGERDSICMGLLRRASPLSNPTSAAIASTSSPETPKPHKQKLLFFSHRTEIVKRQLSTESQ